MTGGSGSYRRRSAYQMNDTMYNFDGTSMPSSLHVLSISAPMACIFVRDALLMRCKCRLFPPLLSEL
jgi:hypothetical protein